MRRVTSIDIRPDAGRGRAPDTDLEPSDAIPDTPPAWGGPTGIERDAAVVRETWQARQARIFAPPAGQQPSAGPDPALRPPRRSPHRPLDGPRDATDAIADRIDRPDAVAEGRATTERTSAEPTGRVSPAAIMSGAAGLVLAAWAVVGLVRAGPTRPLRTPIVEVGGFTGTAILALMVLGAGAMLVLAAATRSRVVIALAGLVVTIAAVALALDPSFGDGALAAERDFAIAVAILSGITTAVALLAADVPRHRRTDRRADGRADQPVVSDVVR